jgi:hypothetical protein
MTFTLQPSNCDELVQIINNFNIPGVTAKLTSRGVTVRVLTKPIYLSVADTEPNIHLHDAGYSSHRIQINLAMLNSHLINLSKQQFKIITNSISKELPNNQLNIVLPNTAIAFITYLQHPQNTWYNALIGKNKYLPILVRYLEDVTNFYVLGTTVFKIGSTDYTSYISEVAKSLASSMDMLPHKVVVNKVPKLSTYNIDWISNQLKILEVEPEPTNVSNTTNVIAHQINLNDIHNIANTTNVSNQRTGTRPISGNFASTRTNLSTNKPASSSYNDIVQDIIITSAIDDTSTKSSSTCYSSDSSSSISHCSSSSYDSSSSSSSDCGGCD